MNTGYLILALGVIGAVLGGSMYAIDWHRTIGLGGVALGIVLVVAGFWLSRSTPKMTVAPAPQP